MPAFIILPIIVLAACMLIALIYKRNIKNSSSAGKGGLVFSVMVFVLSLISFIITFVLFANMGRYVSDFNSSPVLITGGWFWLSMDWLRLLLLFILAFASGLNLYGKYLIFRRLSNENGKG